MFLIFGGVVMLVLSNALGEHHERVLRQRYVPPLLPNTYKDVFVAGQSGKKTLGTMSSTCWARGGICVNIRECPELKIDVGVAGCAWGYKVCCLVHKLSSPTVGKFRRHNIPVISDLKDLGAPLEIIALRNSMLLSTWQTPEPEDDIRLDELLK